MAEHSIEVPEVWQDDNADYYVAVGHHDPALFVLGILAYNVECCGHEEGWEQTLALCDDHGGEAARQSMATLVANVHRVWWRDAHTEDDDERMERCEENDAGAQPFTMAPVA